MKKSFLLVLIVSIIVIVPTWIVVLVVNFNLNKNYEEPQEIYKDITLSIYGYEEKKIVEEIQSDLITISRDITPLVGNVKRCNDSLSEFISTKPKYTDIHLYNVDGTIICQALINDENIFISSGNSFFLDAIETKALSVGEYNINASNTRSYIPFAYPVYTSNGDLLGVVTLGLSISWIDNHFQSLAIVDGSLIALMDYNGGIINSSNTKLTLLQETSRSVIKNQLLGFGINQINEADTKKGYFFFQLQKISKNPISVVVSFNKLGSPYNYENLFKNYHIALIFTVSISVILATIVHHFFSRMIKNSRHNSVVEKQSP
jgi:hypothetical protein